MRWKDLRHKDWKSLWFHFHPSQNITMSRTIHGWGSSRRYFFYRIFFFMLYIVVMVDSGTVSGVKLGQGASSAWTADNRNIHLDHKRKWNSLSAEDHNTLTAANRPLTSCTKCQTKQKKHTKKVNSDSADEENCGIWKDWKWIGLIPHG